MAKLATDFDEPMALLRLLAKKFRDINVLVVGDVVLDRCVYTDRIAERRHKQPLLNVLKYSGKDDRLAAGGAGMIAQVAAAYGAHVRLCGVIGSRDPEARQLQELLMKDKIDFCPIRPKSGSTPVVARFFARIALDRYVEHVRIDRESSRPLPANVEREVAQVAGNLIAGRRPDAVIIADFGRGVVCQRAVERLGRLLGRERIPVVLDGKRCWEALQMPLALAVLSLKEAWDALRDVNRRQWEKLDGGDYPPEWSSAQDCERFVVALMGTFPCVRRFLINDPLGAVLAVDRDEHLHGLYNYALIVPARAYQVQSPVGSECVTTAAATLCLSTKRDSPVHWNDFFRIAYAAKCLSWVKMGTRAEELPGPRVLTKLLRRGGGPGWTWPPIPQEPSIRTAWSEREVCLQQAIEELGPTLALSNAETCVPDFYSVHRGFRHDLEYAVNLLKDLLKQPLAKPARLWIHGSPGSGKDFLFEQIIKKLLGRRLVVVQADERWDPSFNLSCKFRDAKGGAIVLNEIDKGFPEGMEAQLLTLLDDRKSEYGDLLVVGVASKPNEQVAEALLPDTLRRFDPVRDDAAEINIPPFEDRVGDLPYLLVSCVQRRGGGGGLPGSFSKRALEVLVRTPDLLRWREQRPRRFTFTNLVSAADALLKEPVPTVDRDMMAEALGLRPEERRTVFYEDDADTVLVP